MGDRNPCPIGLFILLEVIQIMMVSLKLVGVINLSWFLIFTPTWLPSVIIIVMIIIHWRTYE